MTGQNKEFSKIRSALKKHPDGLSITGISEITGMNRNTLGKYLDILRVAGQVRMKSYGMAKVYTLSRRIPLSSVISYCSDQIIILNRDLRIVEANMAAIKSLRMSREEVIGMPVTTLVRNLRFPEESLEWLKKGMKGENIRKEVTVDNRGAENNYSLRIIPSNFEDNTPGVALISEDITSRKEADSRIKNIRNVIHLANSVTRMSAESESPEEILKTGCELITTSGGYNTAWIVLTGSDGQVIHAAESGLGDLFIPMIGAINNRDLPPSLEMACKGPEGEICQDKKDNSLSACLSFRDKKLGYISAGLHDGRLPDEKEKEFFAEAAGVIGLAVHCYNTERKGIYSAQELLRVREIAAQIIDFIPDSAFATDDEGRVIAWNSPMETLTGIRRNEINRTEDYALALYGDQDPVLIDLLETGTDLPTRYSKIWREGDALCGEKFVPAVHGGRGALLRGKALSLHDSRGRHLGAIEIIHEIIPGDEGDNAIRKALELISSSEAAIALSDGKGRINLVNRAFLTLWGYKRDEAEGRSFVTFWINEEEAEEAFDAAIKEGSWKGVLTAQQKTGATFRVQTSLKSVYYSDGSVEVVICRFSETEEPGSQN